MWDALQDNFSGYANEVEEILVKGVEMLGIGATNGSRNGVAL
jgi:hypothetical protein